jgi:hypothetical protein
MNDEIEIALMKQHDFLLWALCKHAAELEKWKKEYAKFEETF